MRGEFSEARKPREKCFERQLLRDFLSARLLSDSEVHIISSTSGSLTAHLVLLLLAKRLPKGTPAAHRPSD